MSKLSRFKKAPAVKFPILQKKKQEIQFCNDSEDDDDEDFVLKPQRANPPAGNSGASSSASSSQTSEVATTTVQGDQSQVLLSSGSTSISEYFTAPQPPAGATKKQESRRRGGTSQKDVMEKNTTKSRKKPEALPSAAASAVAAGSSLSSADELTSKVLSAINKAKSRPAPPQLPPPASLHQLDDNDADQVEQDAGDGKTPPEEAIDTTEEGKVVCPFCWKKLSDKLTGTTHVKACAKDIPIQQVFEAMQLQEKQIEEWNKLGLAFPGFSTAAKKSKRGNAKQPSSTSTRGRGRGAGGAGAGRKNKKGGGKDDPDLELALALSVSLHEEFESRKAKENQFLIESGLENEVQLAPPPPPPSSSTSKVVKAPPKSSAKVVMALPEPKGPGGRRRGKKVPLQDLPLYTTDADQKKAIVSDRVATILEESQENPDETNFYVRDALPTGVVAGVPKRLSSMQNVDSKLWTTAQQPNQAPEKSFSVLELSATTVIPVESVAANVDLKVETTESSSRKEQANNTDSVPSKSNATGGDSDRGGGCTKSGCSKEVRQVSCPTTSNDALSRKPEVATKNKTKNSVSSLPGVIQDISKMLLNGTSSDVVLYGREEKRIKCHRFMLLARCPRLLDEVIEQVSGNRTRHVIPLTSYSHGTVKAFLWYIYTGTVKSSSDEKVLAELQELGAEYGINVVNEEVVSKEGQKCAKTTTVSVEVEVQTEGPSTSIASTMTEQAMIPEQSPVKNDAVVDADSPGPSSEPEFIFEVSDCEGEMFCDNNSNSPAPPPHAAATLDKDDDGDANCNKSIELFESSDCDDESDPDGKLATPTSPPAPPPASDNPKKSSSSSVPKMEASLISPSEPATSKVPSIEIEDDLIAELLSPPISQRAKTQMPIRKRSRSVSPILNDSKALYTATQIAEIFQLREDGGDVKGYIEKASSSMSKKQKLDLDYNNDQEDDKEEAIELALLDEEFKDVEENDDDDDMNCDSNSNNFCNLAQDQEKSPEIEYPKNNLSLRKSRLINDSRVSRRLQRSASSPNLVQSLSPYLSSLRFSTQQVNIYDDLDLDPDDEDDPFDNMVCGDDDDSLFSKVPDELLAGHFHKSQATGSSRKKSVSMGNSRNVEFEMGVGVGGDPSWDGSSKNVMTPTRKSKQAAAKPRNLTSSEYSSSGPSCSQAGKSKGGSKKKKAGGGGGGKPPPALRLPALQKNISLSQSQAAPPSNMFSENTPPDASNSNGKSPMLNYSLIDTPILKQELKKYGIKPLPRSKAKVLLRHIHKEIHK